MIKFGVKNYNFEVNFTQNFPYFGLRNTGIPWISIPVFGIELNTGFRYSVSVLQTLVKIKRLGV